MTEMFSVIGAGQMGRGIAQVAAQAGYRVALLDVSKEVAEAGKAKIEQGLQRLVRKEKISEQTAKEVVGRIEAHDSYAPLGESLIAVEAATEKESLKLEIFKKMNDAIHRDAILASNTSSISLTKMAAVTDRPAQVVGMHFMNPVPVMKLVEIVRAEQTSDETYRATRELAEALGKTVITSKDRPGFLVNRMLIPFLNEACFCLESEIGSPEDIDQGAKLGLNHPLGPLALADLIGLDTVLFIAEVLHRELGDDKYRPAPILRNYVAAGWLGRKSGRGFYRYGENK